MIRSITFCVNRKLLFIIFYVFVLTAFSFAQNAIVTENANAGNPNSEWGVPDFRDNRIAGYSTKMSLNRGQTVRFKINVQSGATYTIKIYRIGYYGGNGARLMQNLGTFTGTVQPNGTTNTTTGMLDCGNWSESASWAIPSNAVSGLY
ncbi:MAG: N,N-dimethylformamidase beta subunit family domain-containing protein, partial [Chitinophagaceae bacterium]